MDDIFSAATFFSGKFRGRAIPMKQVPLLKAEAPHGTSPVDH